MHVRPFGVLHLGSAVFIAISLKLYIRLVNFSPFLDKLRPNRPRTGEWTKGERLPIKAGKGTVNLISIELNQAGMANHGGKRAGAGRKVGSATKKTRELADAAAAQGITPLEVQLRTMRALWDAATSGPTLDFDKAVAACAIAKDAAPYLHPRLSNIEAQVAVTGHEAALADLE